MAVALMVVGVEELMLVFIAVVMVMMVVKEPLR